MWGREGTRGGKEAEREIARRRREEMMMLGRQRASVEEGRVERGRVDAGNERGRDGGRDREGAREGNFKVGILRRALASIQYNIILEWTKLVCTPASTALFACPGRTVSRLGTGISARRRYQRG